MVPNGPWKFRRSAPSWTMSNKSELETAIERQRRLLESRFRSDYDWLRLVFLTWSQPITSRTSCGRSSKPVGQAVPRDTIVSRSHDDRR